MRRLGCVIWLASVAALAADRRPLLPRPQEVRYLAGALSLRGATIRFASAPSAEDRFAARQLSAMLSATSQGQAARHGHESSGRVILLNRVGEGTAVPGIADTAGPDSREAYGITVTTHGAEIRAHSSAGLFYGVQTLLQMVEGGGGDKVLPCAEIRDWPALPYRGFMMDLSHGQHLRVEEVERQIDLLARFKANQYYFYAEAATELDGYELVNPDGRYTREEIRRIISYARDRHMDVVPCLELYGHLHDLFRVERFSDLSLPRYGREFDPRDPRILDVLDDLIGQTTKLFPSPWYHVGFDEPWALGKIGITPGIDPFDRYMQVLRHVTEQAQRRGKRVLFWADVVNGENLPAGHADLTGNVPEGAIAVPWDYDDRSDFTPFIRPLSKAGIPTVVAAGIWNYDEVFPDYHRTFKNINGMVAAGKKEGALGMLNSGWTDSAQTIYRMSLPGLALGAAAGWQSAPVAPQTFFADYASQTYSVATAEEVTPALEELSTAEEIFARVLEGSTIHRFWADPLEPARLRRMEEHEEDLRQARLQANRAEAHLRRALRTGGNADTLRSLLLAARMFDYLGMKTLYAVEWSKYFRSLKDNPRPELVTLYLGNQIGAQDHSMLADLMDSITGLREEYRQAWLEESTAYRLGTALARWDAECEYWRAMQVRVPEVVREFKEQHLRPSIDSLRPKR